MTGRFEAWLAGGKAAAPVRAAAGPDGTGTAARDAAPTEPERFPGQRYGLPRRGRGAVSGMGRRLVALIVDCVLAALVTLLFVHPHLSDPASMLRLNYWSVLTWLLITVVGTSFSGFTPGMALLGIRVARTDGAAMVLPVRAIVRTVLVATIVPAVVWDSDKRGLHDKIAGTLVIRTR